MRVLKYLITILQICRRLRGVKMPNAEYRAIDQEQWPRRAHCAVRDETQKLVQLKREGVEREGFTPPRLLNDYVEKLLREQPATPALPVSQEKVDLDDVFREALNFAWGERHRGVSRFYFFS